MKIQLYKCCLFLIIVGFISITLLSCKEQDESVVKNHDANVDPYDWIIIPGKDQVVALVNTKTYSQLKSEIDLYKNDVEAKFPVQLNIVKVNWTNTEEVRGTIKELYGLRSISGVVLVGAIPMNRFYMHNFANPNPLYYEAFDLQFIDTNDDGISDSYSGTPILKIWVANLRGIENPNDDGIEVLRTFFNKTHIYYSGNQFIEKRVLAATGSDWPDGANEFADIVKPFFGSDNIDVLNTKDLTRTAIFDAFKNHTYTMFYIQVHSTESFQDLETGTIYASEIAELTTGSLFTINHGCSTGNWLKAYKTRERNTAMSFVFGKSVGQAVVANVRTGMVYGQNEIYERIFTGDYLGKAYLVGKKAAELEMNTSYPDGKIVSGVTFIGNPFVYVNPKK